MKIVTRIGILLLCVCLVCALAGCTERLVQDGPGMENDMPWVAFELYRSDSYSQYNFWITVEQADTGYILTGECQDDMGERYLVEDGIQLPAKEREYLVSLALHDLADVQPSEPDDSDLIVLDAPQYGLVLTYLDGIRQEKAVSSDMTLEIYEHFLPWFQEYGPVE